MTSLPMLSSLSLLILVGCVTAQVSPEVTRPAPEVRGTWMTTTANDAILSPTNTEQSMRRLREIGLNTVYVECWKNGYTEWPSAVMRELIGVEMKINNTPPELQRDLVEETLIEAHRNGLIYVAWLEYGFMASFKDTHNELRALGEREGWLTRTKDGQLVGEQNPFVWMNPLHPVPQQLLIDLTVELVKNYDVDGIQLDDRIAMPVEMGYDDFTRELYRTETGRDLPDNPRDPHFTQWRADKISEYSKRYVAAVRQARPDIIISVSPAPYPWSLENYSCDWPAWVRHPREVSWDEFVPQNYRFNYERTRASIEEGFEPIGDRRSDLLAGIRIVGDGPDMPAEDLLQVIRFTREANLGGHVHWFSRGVLSVYPDLLESFYDVKTVGPAAHPTRGGTRLPAVVAEKRDNTWHATADRDTHRWVWIVRRDGRWSYGPTFDGSPLPDDGYESVELIVRRFEPRASGDD